MTASASLTVYFEGPFWIGLWERTEAGRYTACRIVFGPEPRDESVYQLMLGRWDGLRFSPPVAAGPPQAEHTNPKRLLRQARRQLENQPLGTKAQQALSLQREAGKQAQKADIQARREAEEARRFALRREKRREKHRGH